MVYNGLPLNLGGQAPFDLTFVTEIPQLLSRYDVAYYNKRLSYCRDKGHLYDLLSIPFTAQAITSASDRIKQVQDVLGQQMAVENVSHYCAPGQPMPEIEFLLSVLDAANCPLSLDVNNV